MANNLFLMGFIIFLSDIYMYMYRWFLKNVDNINQKSNKKTDISHGSQKERDLEANG